MAQADQILEEMKRIYEEREKQYRERDEELRSRNEQIKQAMKEVQKASAELSDKEDEVKERMENVQEREEVLKRSTAELNTLQESLEKERSELEEDVSKLKLEAQMELAKTTTLRMEAERVKEKLDYELSLKQCGIEIAEVKGFPEDAISMEEHQQIVGTLEDKIAILEAAREKDEAEITTLVNEKADLIKKMISSSRINDVQPEETVEEPAPAHELEAYSKDEVTDQPEKSTSPQTDAQPTEEPGQEASEDLTADVMLRYLNSTEGYLNVEKRHSADGEIVSAIRSGLSYHFVFSSLPRFDISKERKYDRALKKTLLELNKMYPETKFDYEDGKAIASTYFTSDMPLYGLVEAMDRVSDAFIPKE